MIKKRHKKKSGLLEIWTKMFKSTKLNIEQICQTILINVFKSQDIANHYRNLGHIGKIEQWNPNFICHWLSQTDGDNYIVMFS